LKVLHLTNWFPSSKNPYEALWIRNHISALAKVSDDYQILHLEVKPSRRLALFRHREEKLLQRIFEIPSQRWILVEIVSGILLIYYLLKLKYRKFDLINAHIAYPNLTFWHFVKGVFKKPIIITEHWSAYNFSFGVVNKKKLRRIRRIFRQGIPVIAVSNSLLKDIKSFAQVEFPGYVVPNIVDTSTFRPAPTRVRQNFFFMLSQWKWPKRPLVILSAFRDYLAINPEYVLKIGGYGPDWNEMKEWVRRNNLSECIELLGPMDRNKVADQMKSCRAFLHCSDYETFSVVCAEAICCGAPVVASKVGGISEFISDTNGILVDQNTPEEWVDALNRITRMSDSFDNIRFAKAAIDRFSVERIGCLYHNTLRYAAKLHDA
jgi:glycosyltransferase involved in cell wall biosynthesis